MESNSSLGEIAMKRVVLVFSLLVLSNSAFAIELVCKGGQPRMQDQRTVYIDCSNRKAVIDILGAAWRELRNQGIGGNTEDLCWDPYQQAKELHPSIPLNGIAQTFFAQCNMALRYIK